MNNPGMYAAEEFLKVFFQELLKYWYIIAAVIIVFLFMVVIKIVPRIKLKRKHKKEKQRL